MRFAALLVVGASLADCFSISSAAPKMVPQRAGKGVSWRPSCAFPIPEVASIRSGCGRGRSKLRMSGAGDDEMVDISAEELEELMIKAGRVPPELQEPGDQLEGAIQGLLRSPAGAAMFQNADAAGFA